MTLSLPHPSHFSFHVQNPEGSDRSCPGGCHGYTIAAPDPGVGGLIQSASPSTLFIR